MIVFNDFRLEMVVRFVYIGEIIVKNKLSFHKLTNKTFEV